LEEEAIDRMPDSPVCSAKEEVQEAPEELAEATSLVRMFAEG